MRGFFIFIAFLSVAAPLRAETLRIMPLGDSITTGNDSSNLTPGGYRTTLFNLLSGTGYDFGFVGSMTGNPGPIPDNDHEGRSGFTIEQLRQTVGPSVVANQPDIILLLAGTNDVTVSLKIDPTLLTVEGIAGRLDSLLSDLYTYRPTATVFVGTIPPAATTEDGTQHSALMPRSTHSFPMCWPRIQPSGKPCISWTSGRF